MEKLHQYLTAKNLLTTKFEEEYGAALKAYQAAISDANPDGVVSHHSRKTEALLAIYEKDMNHIRALFLGPSEETVPMTK